MANLQRYGDPFGDIVDDLFKGFFVRPVVGEGLQQSIQRMKVEVVEDENAYRVQAEIPGVKKEDIHVTIDGEQLSISAEVKQEKEAKENGGRVVHSERYYGKVARSFRLGQEIDQANTQARYNEGVLELTLPKRATEKAKQITIQ
ncbi:MAG TPA: Hsp20/alpha crystallin family protein [Burkholderiales bacterium]|nr:Hsp20/alpha crystallin family protein [Burkholderiales bacterium]